MRPESVSGCSSVVLIRRDVRICTEQDHMKLNRQYSTDGIYLRILNLLYQNTVFLTCNNTMFYTVKGNYLKISAFPL